MASILSETSVRIRAHIRVHRGRLPLAWTVTRSLAQSLPAKFPG
jgi:hypothetical protein